MPNWCDNYLEVVGSKKDIEDFKATCMKVKDDDEFGGELSLSAVVPLPNIEDMDILEIAAKWGTKWEPDINNWQISIDPQGSFGVITMSFNSAWSPPTAWLVECGKRWPDLRFTLEYEEGGMDFAGIMIVEGESVSDEPTTAPSAKFAYKGALEGAECVVNKLAHLSPELFSKVESAAVEQVHELLKNEESAGISEIMDVILNALGQAGKDDGARENRQDGDDSEASQKEDVSGDRPMDPGEPAHEAGH